MDFTVKAMILIVLRKVVIVEQPVPARQHPTDVLLKVIRAETVGAIRYSLHAGLRSVFWLGAVTMLLAFLIICTIPAKTSCEE